MWVICVGCHHAVNIKVPKNKRLRCTVCGSTVARTVVRLKHQMLNGGQMPAEEARKLTLGALISIASHRGYKPVWAHMKYKTIFGEYPKFDAEMQNPSGELLWWIKREGRAYAKMMREKDGGEWKKGGRPSKLNPTGVEKDSALMSKDDWQVDL